MGVVSGVMVRHCTNIPETRWGSGKSEMKGARNVKTINSKNYDNWETIFSFLYSQRIWSQHCILRLRRQIQ